MSAGVRDVAVIGAGVMGSAAARWLAITGRDVVVLEKYDLRHERGGSHGRTRLFRMAVDNADYVRRVAEARRLWHALEEESGRRLLEVTGAVDHGVDDRTVAGFPALFRGFGVAHEVLRAEEAAERWPGMRFETPVLYQPESGRLLAEQAWHTLQDLARRAGVEFCPRRPAVAVRVVASGTRHDGALIEVDTPGGAVRARHLVVAAGPWTPELLAGLVQLPPIRTTQEQPRLFPEQMSGARWPSFVHWRRGAEPLSAAEAYGLREPGAGVKVGLHATGPVVHPDERSFRPDPTVDAALLRYVEQWLPGLSPRGSTPISCLYDNTADETFMIDRFGPITVATGFCGQGFKFVPLVAQQVCALVTGTGR